MSPGVLTTAMTSSTAPQYGQSGGKGGVTSPPAEEETTTTLITTTTITTVHTPGILSDNGNDYTCIFLSYYYCLALINAKYLLISN